MIKGKAVLFHTVEELNEALGKERKEELELIWYDFDIL